MDGKEWEQTSCGRQILRKGTASVLITQLKMKQSCNSKNSIKKKKKKAKKLKKEKNKDRIWKAKKKKLDDKV